MVQPYVPHVLLRLCVIGALAHTGSIGQDAPFIAVSPDPNPCFPQGTTDTIACVTRIYLSSLNDTIETAQEWEVTFPNGSHPPAGRLESSNPLTFLPGWNVNIDAGLTISNVTLDLNGTMLICFAIGAGEDAYSEAIILTIGGKPGNFSCSSVCNACTCLVNCSDPATEACTPLTSLTLNLIKDGKTIYSLESNETNFTIEDLLPNSSYVIVVTANNDIGSTSAPPLVIQTEIGYLDEKGTTARVLSEENEMVNLSVVCALSDLSDLPDNTGCQVCSGSSGICSNIDNPDNQRNISKNITLDVPEGELRELSIYAIDNSSNRFDGCPENISLRPVPPMTSSTVMSSTVMSSSVIPGFTLKTLEISMAFVMMVLWVQNTPCNYL